MGERWECFKDETNKKEMTCDRRKDRRMEKTEMVVTMSDNENNKAERRSRRRRVRKVFWGLLMLLSAGALLANSMGVFGEISFWPIFFSVVLVAVFVDGIFRRNFGEMLFSLAFLVIVNDEFLGLEAITPWPVLIAALLGTMGLKMLFPGFKKKKRAHYHGSHHESVSREHRDGDSLSLENSFGESVKYITEEIANVNVHSSFGAMKVYFADAVLKENKAYVNVESSFGSVELYVPANWQVIMDVETAFGSAELKHRDNMSEENVLYVTGGVSFGELVIKNV